MGDKFNKIIEGYKPIASRRMFYPRNMKLSEDFVNAFHREYDRLVGEGQNVKSLVERFGKAMKFHAREDRNYHKLDEEKAARELEEKKNTMQYDSRSGTYFKPVNRNEKPKKKKKKIEEERWSQTQSIGAGASSEIDPKTGKAKDCVRRVNGKNVPCKPNSRGTRKF
tara:strand:- start:22232 stop:22732 length:501 start_codon:yes stop_codon:yes gene_type:complete